MTKIRASYQGVERLSKVVFFNRIWEQVKETMPRGEMTKNVNESMECMFFK